MSAVVDDRHALSAMTTPPGGGYVRIGVRPDGAARVTHARAASPLRVFTPRVAGGAAWIVTSTLGGGLVGGDDIRLSIDVDAGARTLVTTQASTKVYRSTIMARQSLDARVGDDSLLVVLPDPITAFARSTYEQRQSYALAGRASLVTLDWMTAGRRAAGERWAFDHYGSRSEVLRSGRRVFHDHLWLSQDDGPVGDRMREFNVYALAILAGPQVAPIATAAIAAIADEPVRPRAETIVSAAPIDRTGATLRVAGVSVEHVAAVLRGWLGPVAALVGVDPWTRRW